MLLQAANIPVGEADRRLITGLLTNWLQELTDTHPTYRRYNASRGTTVHDFYKVPGV